MVRKVDPFGRFCRAGEPEKAMQMLEEMKLHGLQPRVGDYEVVLDTLLREGIVHPAYDLINDMHRSGIKPNATRMTWLVSVVPRSLTCTG